MKNETAAPAQKVRVTFTTADHEAGNRIETFDSLIEAQKALRSYVDTDIADGTYTPRFYDIRNNATGEIVEVSQ